MGIFCLKWKFYKFFLNKRIKLGNMSAVIFAVYIAVFDEVIFFNFLLEFLFGNKEVFNSVCFAWSGISGSIADWVAKTRGKFGPDSFYDGSLALSTKWLLFQLQKGHTRSKALLLFPFVNLTPINIINKTK